MNTTPPTTLHEVLLLYAISSILVGVGISEYLCVKIRSSDSHNRTTSGIEIYFSLDALPTVRYISTSSGTYSGTTLTVTMPVYVSSCVQLLSWTARGLICDVTPTESSGCVRVVEAMDCKPMVVLSDSGGLYSHVMRMKYPWRCEQLCGWRR